MSYNVERTIIISIATIGGVIALLGSTYPLGKSNAIREINRSNFTSTTSPSNAEIRQIEGFHEGWTKLAKRTAESYVQIYLDKSTSPDLRQETKKNIVYLLKDTDDMIAKIQSLNIDKFNKDMIEMKYIGVKGFIMGFLETSK
jgi:hypothetical protein